jgi:hypothetical protein
VATLPVADLEPWTYSVVSSAPARRMAAVQALLAVLGDRPGDAGVAQAVLR